MRALIGLGNPGEQYDKTRHNIGFACLDAVATSLGEKTWKRLHDSLVIETNIEGEKCFLVKPQQFMNNSGKPIRTLADYYDLKPEQLCIVADDVYVAPGSVRIRQSGGDGGHNGWKSIITALGPDDFWRVRVGVGLYEQKAELAAHLPALEDYVLQRMPAHDTKTVDVVIDKLVPNLVEWLKYGTISTETFHL